MLYSLLIIQCLKLCRLQELFDDPRIGTLISIDILKTDTSHLYIFECKQKNNDLTRTTRLKDYSYWEPVSFVSYMVLIRARLFRTKDVVS